MTDDFRAMMSDKISELELTELAERNGLVTLRDACLARVADGATTLEEVIRVTMARQDNAAAAEAAPLVDPAVSRTGAPEQGGKQ
ncbi:MAG: hypothetical protein VYE68_15345 [Acidobacteriota bacterium]|nr:hypothetical protein [Acidobacteriota bacterium]